MTPYFERNTYLNLILNFSFFLWFILFIYLFFFFLYQFSFSSNFNDEQVPNAIVCSAKSHISTNNHLKNIADRHSCDHRESFLYGSKNSINILVHIYTYVFWIYIYLRIHVHSYNLKCSWINLNLCSVTKSNKKKKKKLHDLKYIDSYNSVYISNKIRFQDSSQTAVRIVHMESQANFFIALNLHYYIRIYRYKCEYLNDKVFFIKLDFFFFVFFL